MPLRHVYTSLFSTGLHLQNSLLKLRHMEGLFESLEKSKDKETVANFMPDEQQMLEWLQGFQDIQGELNVCTRCLRPSSPMTLVSRAWALRMTLCPEKLRVEK